MTQGGRKIATRQRRTPEAWLAALEGNGTALDEMTPIARDAAIEEMVMMGLRLVAGVSRERLERLAERPLDELFGDALPRLIDGGFLTLDAERLAATDAGRQRLNAVLAALLGSAGPGSTGLRDRRDDGAQAVPLRRAAAIAAAAARPAPAAARAPRNWRICR